jgi:hypothetical protein
MVKSIINNIFTYYPSSSYQIKTDGTHTNTRKYYNFSGAVVAMSAPKRVLREKRGSYLAFAHLPWRAVPGRSGKLNHHYG